MRNRGLLNGVSCGRTTDDINSAWRKVGAAQKPKEDDAAHGRHQHSQTQERTSEEKYFSRPAIPGRKRLKKAMERKRDISLVNPDV